MSVVFTGSRCKLGFEVRLYRDDETGLTIARLPDGRVLAIDKDSEVAFWRGWSLVSGMRPMSIIRNHFGRFRFVVSSAVPLDSPVLSITYPAWGRATIRFRPVDYAPPVLAA